MRKPQHLSYSSMTLWEKNSEEYYLKHISVTRAPKIPQEHPAAAGSCWDAFAKSALHAALYGPNADPKYSFQALFEAQVEEHNRDWALAEGKYVFDSYVNSGAYDDLLSLLQQSIEPPRFEFSVNATLAGVPFNGKPDCRFVLPGPVHVVHDWKLNGFCSKSATSPTKGYMKCRDGNNQNSKKNGEAHKQFVPLDYHGLVIDTGYMEDLSTEWADQLSMYGWALGEKIGDQNVVLSVHQCVAKPMPAGRPTLRFSEYRARVRDSYQGLIVKRMQRAWQHITSGHFLHNMTREDSIIRCQMLENESVGLQSDGSSRDNFFAECVRPKYRG